MGARLRLPMLALLALIGLGGVAVRAADGDVVGKAGTMDIRGGAVRAYLSALPEAERSALAQDPEALARAVRTYMAERLVLQAAHDAGFDMKSDIAARLERARETQLMDLFLQAEAGVPPGYPSEQEVRALYEENKGKLVAPARYRLAQIFIAAPKDESASAKLDAVMAKLKGKGATSQKGFAALAKTFSDSKIEAARGGEIGWLAEPAIAPEIRSAFKDLKPGAVTPPIRLANGWHIVRLLAIAPPGTTPVPFDKVRDQLTAQMRRQKLEQVRRDYISTLIEKNGLTLDDEALKALATRLR